MARSFRRASGAGRRGAPPNESWRRPVSVGGAGAALPGEWRPIARRTRRSSRRVRAPPLRHPCVDLASGPEFRRLRGDGRRGKGVAPSMHLLM